MRKVFIDANIVLDYLDRSSQDHSIAKACIYLIGKYCGKPIVSPATFLITNYVRGKVVKNKQWHKEQMKKVFTELEMTPLHPEYIEAVFQTHFLDLEDCIQYQCAEHANAHFIVTKDMKDFFFSTIIVLHPAEFIVQYKDRLAP